MSEEEATFQEFIKKEGFVSIGGDLLKCPEGETWDIDEVWDLMKELQWDLL